MQQYLDLLQHVLDHGVDRDDRTGIGTRSVFGAQVRYDLSAGFPALTTKQLHFKSIVHELLWFLAGDTNVKYLRDHGVKIWDAWADEEGNLGPVYGKQWRAWQRLYEVEPRRYPVQAPVLDVQLSDPLQPDFGVDTSGLVGRVFDSSSWGSYRVLREYRLPRSPESSSTRLAFDVQFTRTGYISAGVVKAAVLRGQIRDPYVPVFLGVACTGDTSRFDKKVVDLLKETWKGVIKRCYDSNHVGYSRYGGRGVFVDRRWLVFEYFIEDVQCLPNWLLKLDHPDDYMLDKDFYGSNKYGPETCLWLSREEQSLNTELTFPFVAIPPQGGEIYCMGVRPLAEAYGLKAVCIRNCLDGKAKSHHGWRFRPVQTDRLIRVRVFDQMRQLLSAIRHQPHSRRLIINAWNVGDLEDMALPPCHMNMQFYVSDGRLSCQLYQRSADIFLGVPFNIASYALLTHMIAQVTGLGVGDFVHTFGDLHLYHNHVEQARTQLARAPLPLPRLELDPAVRDLFAFRAEHIVIADYQSHPAIKAPIAV